MNDVDLVVHDLQQGLVMRCLLSSWHADLLPMMCSGGGKPC